MASLICAIDQGTTGTTVLILDTDLNLRAKGYAPFQQHFPKPGWVEHQPEEIWQSLRQAVAEATSLCHAEWGTGPGDIKAVGLTNQRETTVVWDRATGEALYPAIVWQDRRTAGRLQQLREEGCERWIQDRTGLLLDPYFSASKMEWILGRVAPVATREVAVGTIDSYVVWRMTGGKSFVTDRSNASRTMLYSLEKGDWDGELADLFSIPMEYLPKVMANTGEYGRVEGVPGLLDGTPITGMAGDQQAALFGQAAFEAGEAKCTYGTGAFLLLNTGEEVVKSASKMLTTVAWQLSEGGPVTYALEGSAFVAGALVDWLCNTLGLYESPQELERLAGEVAGSEGVVLVPSLAGLGAPHWNPMARGMLRGLTRGTGRGEIARAALEGIALQTVELLRAMEVDYGSPITGLKVDGNAAQNDLMMQLQSDFFDRPIVRPSNVETTATGAALLAGLGAGLFENLSDLKSKWTAERIFTPKMDPRTRSAHLQAWNEAIASL